MEKTYDVLYKNDCVGQVSVRKEGLYCYISCCAKIQDKTMCRLWALGENYSHDFGLCIPQEDGIGLTTRIPAKYFTREQISFVLREGRKHREFFVPVSAEKPFPYLERLEYAYLRYKDGSAGVYFQDDANC